MNDQFEIQTNEHLQILLSEYDNVHKHWLLATKQKAIILQLSGTLVAGIVGAGILQSDKVPVVWLWVLGHLIVLLGSMVYVQKEADYWAAAICLKSIEDIVNKQTGLELLSYVGRFKELLFQRQQPLISGSPIRVLQLVRMVPLALPVAYCTVLIFKSVGLFACTGYAVATVGLTAYIVHSRCSVLRRAEQQAKTRVKKVIGTEKRVRAPKGAGRGNPPESPAGVTGLAPAS